MPRTGIPFSTRAIFTVNSSFLLINSLVPSKGSINQKVLTSFAVDKSLSSSESIGISSFNFESSLQIISWDESPVYLILCTFVMPFAGGVHFYFGGIFPL